MQELQVMEIRSRPVGNPDQAEPDMTTKDWIQVGSVVIGTFLTFFLSWLVFGY